MGHIQCERLPKSRMASSDNDRFTFEIVHVLYFRNGLNEELCCRFIFTDLQQSLDLQVRCDQKFQSPIWRLIFRIWSPKQKIQSHWRRYQAQFYALILHYLYHQLQLTFNKNEKIKRTEFYLLYEKKEMCIMTTVANGFEMVTNRNFA